MEFKNSFLILEVIELCDQVVGQDQIEQNQLGEYELFGDVGYVFCLLW